MKPLKPRLTGLLYRTRRQLLLAAVTGLLVGLGVAAFEWVTREQLYDRLVTAPLVVQAGAPLVGFVLAALSLRYLAQRATPSTADEYIKNFHDHDEPLALKPVLGRIVAGVATLGLRRGTRIRGAVALSRRGDRLRAAGTLAPMVLALRHQGLDGRRSGGRRGRHLQDAGHRCHLRPRGSVPGRHRAPDAPARAASPPRRAT